MSERDLIECEEWRPVPSAPGYSASSLGRIRRDAGPIVQCGYVRIWAGGILRARSLPSGHQRVTLSIRGARVHRLVHRLIAECFLPPPDGGDQDCVLHRDDTPANNRPSNLFWGTRHDNIVNMVQKGRQSRGERQHCAKLTDTAVRDIRLFAASGRPQKEIAAEFGITRANVSLIVAGRTWRHVR